MAQDPIRSFDGFWALRDHYVDRAPTFRIQTRDDRLYTAQLAPDREPRTQDNFDFGGEARIIPVVSDDVPESYYAIEGEAETVLFRGIGYHRQSPDALERAGLELRVKRQTVVGLEVTTDD